MTREIPLHIVVGEPRVLDIDLAIALGMSRPIDIRTGLMKMLSEELAHYGPVHRQEMAYYLNEQQARAVCRTAMRRKSVEADDLVVLAFRKFHNETRPRMSVQEVLRHGLEPFAGKRCEGSERMVMDVLCLKLGQSARPQKLSIRLRDCHVNASVE